MIITFTKDSIDDLQKYLGHPIYQGFQTTTFLAEKAGIHLLLLQSDSPAARCSLWWENTPQENGKCVGTIGHFEAVSQAATDELLTEACAILKAKEIGTVLAPMNGNTWRSYRFVTKKYSHPPFLMEPVNDENYPHYFLNNGFSVCKEYVTYLETELTPTTVSGISFKPITMEHLSDYLNIIYDISVKAFCDNPYYTELNREDFINQYLQFKNFIIPELVLIAYDNTLPVAFFFCIPDYNEKAYQEKVTTIIFKTAAVLPEYRGQKISKMLFEAARNNAIKCGFTKGIDALIYKGNISEKICKNNTLMREYSLFRKEL